MASDDSSFQAIYGVDQDWHLPASFKAKDFPDVVDIILLGKSGADRRLLTTWKNEERFVNHTRHVFESALALKAPVYTGSELRLVKSATPWFRRYYAILITVVAVLSNIDSLRQFTLDAIRAPTAAAYPKQTKLVVPAGSSVEVEFRLQNLTDGPNVIKVTGVDTGGIASNSVLFQPWEAQMSGHQRESYSVTVLAQQLHNFLLKPVGTVEAGWLRGWLCGDQPLQVASGCEIEVWAAIDRKPDFKIIAQTDTGSTIAAIFRHGMPPEKLAYQCDLNLPPDWRVYANDIAGARVVQGKDTAIIQWSAKSTPKTDQTFHFTVSHPVSATDILGSLNPQFFVEPQL